MFGKRSESGQAPEKVVPTADQSAQQIPESSATAPVPVAKAVAKPAAKPEPQVAKKTDEYYDVKTQIFGALIDTIDLSQLAKMDSEQAREEIRDIVNDIITVKNVVLSISEQEELLEDICNDVLGYGPLEPLLARDDISDIMVNGAGTTFIEVEGKVLETNVRFRDNGQLLNVCQRIVSQVGRRVDESSPICDARLPDGSRVNVIAPPLAIDGACLTIRKFKKDKLTLAKLVEFGSISPAGSRLLEVIGACRLNILISGGTGSGKTTLLNAMSAYIDGRERIVTIEDAAELQMQQIHVARLETRPLNIEGKGEVTQRELVKNALRMRPDRIVVGEVRAGEAFDMLQAMNTGHEGSMTTVHANSCRDSLGRIEQMVGMAGFEMPMKSVRGQIASALNVVIQLERMSDGRRRLVSLNEITGMEGDVVTMHEIFKFRRLRTDADGNIDGEFVATGIRPKFMDELETRGIRLASDMFNPNRVLG